MKAKKSVWPLILKLFAVMHFPCFFDGTALMCSPGRSSSSDSLEPSFRADV